MKTEIIEARAAQDIEAGFVTRSAIIVPAKPFPHVGQTCVIRHQVKRNSAGEVVGLNRADRDTRVVITAVYIDGKVRTGTSDVWDVKPSTNNTWETINPLREEK